MSGHTPHTPGPWEYPRRGNAVRALNGRKVAEPWLAYMSSAERDANARLIAAAPELLAALQKMVDSAEHTGSKPDCLACQAYKEAKRIIAKASTP